MEQKKTLWIVAAAGIFLLVVAGAALILYSPSLHRTPIQQASFDPATGWVSNISTIPSQSQNSVSSQPISQAPASPFENAASENIASISSAESVRQIPETHPENLTVITENATVYSNSTTTIDLNSLKAANNNPVTAQNRYTEEKIASAKQNQYVQSQPVQSPAENYYTPAPKAAAPKVASATTAKKAETAPKAAPAKKTTTAAAPKKAETAVKVASAAKSNPEKFWVQPAAYSSKKHADEARALLESNKITSEVFTITDSNGKTFYRVRIGPYVTKSEAEYWQTRVAMIDKFADSKSLIIPTKTN